VAIRGPVNHTKTPVLGAFANFHIIDADFAYHVPEEIVSSHAAVLMCAGASTYEALDAAGVKPHHRVGIVGFGGLGHMALLFAKAMGCSVTVFCRSEDKMKDAFVLEADGYQILGDNVIPNNDSDPPVDVLLVCSNETPDLENVLPFLSRRATIVLMTIQQKPLTVPYMSFILPGHKIIASTEASRANHLAMMRFAARHKISPWVEEFPMTEDGLSVAFARLGSGKMRFRGVLKVPEAGI
jgi:alcohol dehydrogenase (NADP+)